MKNNFIINCLKGIGVGAVAIIPGISSGVICVILGIYEKLLNSVMNFFKDIKTNLKFLFPIILGIGIGAVLFGNILKYLFITYPLQTNFTFIGLILGCLPLLFKQVNSKVKFRLSNMIYAVISLIIGILMVYLENSINIENINQLSFGYLVFAGIVMSIGVIIPGVSSTVILMLIGVYELYLDSIATIYLPILIPMGIGLVIGSVICMKLTQILLEKYYAQTFYSIIGFSIGSVLVLYPGLPLDIGGIIATLCCILGFIIATIFEK